MLSRIEKAATPRRRKFAYGVTTAALGVVAAYGLVDGQALAAWLLLVAAVTGMAAANTDTATADGMPRRAVK